MNRQEEIANESIGQARRRICGSILRLLLGLAMLCSIIFPWYMEADLFPLSRSFRETVDILGNRPAAFLFMSFMFLIPAFGFYLVAETAFLSLRRLL